MISPAVRREASGLTHPAGRAAIEAALRDGWLVEESVPAQSILPGLKGSLDPGEAEVIALSSSTAADVILLDERRGRLAARERGLAGSKAGMCEDAFMRTTVELPDELFRQAKARAALQGRALKDLVADGLRLLLQNPAARSPAASRRTQFPIIKPKDSARRLTPEMVEAAEDQLLTEEGDAHAKPSRRRGSAGAWARRFTGVAKLAPGETTDKARMEHYRKKYGV